jgi:hypothetical protein
MLASQAPASHWVDHDVRQHQPRVLLRSGSRPAEELFAVFLEIVEISGSGQASDRAEEEDTVQGSGAPFEELFGIGCTT